MQDQLVVLMQILLGWIILYAISKILRIEKYIPWITIGPIYIMIKSKRLNIFLEKWSLKHEHILRKILDLGIITGYVLMGLVFYFLASSLFSFFETRGATPMPNLIIPGITVSFDTLLKMLPGIVILLFTHELAHKVAMHVNNVPVKNVGILLFYVIPGAFVEPDDKVFSASPPHVRMQVLAAGTFINIIVGGMFAPIIFYPSLYNQMISPFYGAPSGVLVREIIPHTTLANQSFIKTGDVILEINNINIKNISTLYHISLKPGEIVKVTYLDRVRKNVYSVDLTACPDPNNISRGILGFIPANYYPPKYDFLDPVTPLVIYEIIFWIFFLGVNIAIFNMIPIIALDGYGHLDALLEMIGISEDNRKKIMIIISIGSLSLIVIDLAVGHLKGLIFK